MGAAAPATDGRRATGQRGDEPAPAGGLDQRVDEEGAAPDQGDGEEEGEDGDGDGTAVGFGATVRSNDVAIFAGS